MINLQNTIQTSLRNLKTTAPGVAAIVALAIIEVQKAMDGKEIDIASLVVTVLVALGLINARSQGNGSDAPDKHPKPPKEKP